MPDTLLILFRYSFTESTAQPHNLGIKFIIFDESIFIDEPI
jgi:hypothetical protein